MLKESLTVPLLKSAFTNLNYFKTIGKCNQNNYLQPQKNLGYKTRMYFDALQGYGRYLVLFSPSITHSVDTITSIASQDQYYFQVHSGRIKVNISYFCIIP